MAKSLCCPPETITTLLIGYTPIQKKEKRLKEERIEEERSTVLRESSLKSRYMRY